MHAGRYDNVLNIPIFRSIKHRLPWLILGLVGGMLGAGIVNQFEGLLSRYLILASFIPLIVYMADAVGTQMEAFIIRDLAVNPKLKFFAYFWRQASIVVLIGILASALLFLGAEMIFHNFVISLVLGIALFLAILTSLVTGLIVPYLFGKLRLDPANASGPIATIIQDILSVLVYFSVATWLL